jgi:hypothetical protein
MGVFWRKKPWLAGSWIAWSALIYASPAWCTPPALSSCGISTILEQVVEAAPRPFHPWSFGYRGHIDLSPEQLLPRSYIDRVEAERGKLQLLQAVNAGQATFRITVPGVPGKSLGKTVMQWKLIRDPVDPRTIYLDQLMLQNPLAGAARAGLNVSQMDKGLPADVFRFARNQLFEFLRAGGYSKLKATGAQNYGVQMLYLRMVGMKPATPEGTRLTALINRDYVYAKRSLPENLRLDSANDFVATLGEYHHLPFDDRIMFLWQRFVRTGELPEGARIVKDEEGKDVALLIEGVAGRKPQVVWINPYTQPPSLLSWSKIARSGQMRLEMELPVRTP